MPRIKADAKVHQPHDKHFFNALNNKVVAEDLIQNHLPKIISEQAIFDEMVAYNPKFVSAQQKEFRSDFIYQVPLTSGGKALAFIHFEHQSTSEKDMPLRIWQYLMLLLIEYHENHPKEDLPLVYPCIVYTGKSQYRHSTNLFDLFGKNKEIVKEWITGDIKLIDVCRLSDEEIKQHKIIGLTEFAFKHRFKLAFNAILENIFTSVQNHPEIKKKAPHYIRNVIEYLLEVMPDSDAKVFDNTVRKYFTGKMGEEIMNAAQQYRQEGLEQGLEQGKNQERLNFAKRLAARGYSIEAIQDVTELSKQAIKKLVTKETA